MTKDLSFSSTVKNDKIVRSNTMIKVRTLTSSLMSLQWLYHLVYLSTRKNWRCE